MMNYRTNNHNAKKVDYRLVGNANIEIKTFKTYAEYKAYQTAKKAAAPKKN